MKAKSVAVALILSGLFVTSNITHACNYYPVAKLTVSPKYVTIGENVLLDGSASYDRGTASNPYGYITKYEWDWDYDYVSFKRDYWETSSHKPDGAFDGKHTHAYSEAEVYTVYLRVTDNGGAGGPLTDFSPGRDVYVSPDIGIKVVCVKYGASGSGSSWDDALGDLKSALDIFDGTIKGQIWVAEATYKPDTTGLSDPREATFQLENKVGIYGGFCNTETGIFSDNFDDGDYFAWNIVDEGTTASPSAWSASSSVMVQSSSINDSGGQGLPALGTYAWYCAGASWINYRTKLTMSSDDDGAIGLMFRYKDNDNYYRFSWNKKHSYRRLVKRVNGVVSLLAGDSMPYVTGQDYQIEVIAQGNVLQVWIDGTLVFSVTDDNLSSGSIALYSWDNAGSNFDNIVVDCHERDWDVYPTILSGDLNGDDESGGDNSENTYHVVTGADDALLDGFTVTGGNADGSDPDDDGGGIYCYQTSPQIENCMITNNHAATIGGGIFCWEASLKIRNCIILRNAAVGGSGMYIWGSSALIEDCQFTENSSTSTQFGGGGGATIGWTPAPTYINCIFTGNHARYGGAVQISTNCSPTLKNCIFSGNSADLGGGGVATNNNASPTLINCTLVTNEATTDGGGIFNDSASTTTVTNCILWDNRDAGGTNESAQIHISGGTVVVNYTCVWDWTGGLGGTGNFGDDPLFVDLAGGNYHLDPDSPCINTGDPGGDYSGQTDMDGSPRVMGARVDIGADEVEIDMIYVDSTAAAGGDGLSWSTAFNDLQYVLSASSAGDEIWVKAGTYKPTTGGDRSISFDLKAGTALYGGFAGNETNRDERDWVNNKTILSGDIDNDDVGVPDNGNSYHVLKGADDAIIDGFVVMGGYGDSSDGSGMLNDYVSPIVRNCMFIGNYAYFGGGIHNDHSTPQIINCIFSGNTSYKAGGGMSNYNAAPSIVNCTFSKNVTTEFGGGIYNMSSSPGIINCIFWGNVASVAGNQMAFEGGFASVNYSCIQDYSNDPSQGIVSYWRMDDNAANRYVAGSNGPPTELVTNGKFTSPSGWTFGGNWSYDMPNGEADHSGWGEDALSRDVSVTAGKKYMVIFTVKNYSFGGVAFILGGQNGTERSANGTYVEVVTAINTDGLEFWGVTSYTGSIDDVFCFCLDDFPNTGIFYDNTGNPYTNAHDTTGEIDGALNFDGVDDYVEVSGLTNPVNMTYVLWIKADSLSGGYDTLLEFGNDEPWFGILSTGEITLYGYVTSSRSITIGQWHHIAVTSDGSESIIYIDGQADAGSANTDTGTGLGIGYHSGDPHFDGIIDDVRIYNRALTAGEIQQLYQKAFIEAGEGNIDSNPLFVDADGPDNIAGTLDDDLRLLNGSPCIGTGLSGDNMGVNWPADATLVVPAVSVTDPVDLVVNDAGNVYVLSSSASEVKIYNDQLILQNTISVSATNPKGVAVDSDNKIYVADTGADRILRYTSGGTLDPTFDDDGIVGQPGTGDGEFDQPWGIAVDFDGYVYVTDSANNRVQIFNSIGTFFGKWGDSGTGDGQMNSPCGFGLFGSSEIFLADTGNSRIQHFTALSGNFLHKVGEPGTQSGQFNNPRDVCYDIDYDQIVVADSGNNRIQIFKLSNDELAFVKAISDQSFSGPMGVVCAPDEASQVIYVADTGNNRVMKLKVEHDEPGNSPHHILYAFKSALQTDDVDKALTFFDDAVLGKYAVALEELRPEFQNMVNGMGNLILISSGANVARYKMLHDEGGGVTSAFPVYFIKDENGSWKIYVF